jgi:hypothetical protein
MIQSQFSLIESQFRNVYPFNPTQVSYIRFKRRVDTGIPPLPGIGDNLMLGDRLKTHYTEIDND